MKIKDLLSTAVIKESSVNEAPFNIGQPMGALSTAGNKLMAKMGSQTAQGRLQAGDVANELSNAIKQYLGRTGQKGMTGPDFINFLKQNGYPTAGAMKVIQAHSQKQSGTGPVSQGNAAVGGQSSAVQQEPTMEPQGQEPQQTSAAPQSQAPQDTAPSSDGVNYGQGTAASQVQATPATGGAPQPSQAQQIKQNIAKSRTANKASGFNQYVKQGGTRLSGADAQGNPTFKNVREGAPNQNVLLPQDVLNKAIMAAVQDSSKAGGVTGGVTRQQTAQAGGSSLGGAGGMGGRAGGGSVEQRLANLEKIMGVR